MIMEKCIQRLEFPFPPSVNGATKNAKWGGRTKTNKVIKWQQLANIALSGGYVMPIVQRCIIVIVLKSPDKRPRDDQNYAKVLIDFLVDKGILMGDSQQYIQSTVTMWVDEGKPCVVYFKCANEKWLEAILSA